MHKLQKPWGEAILVCNSMVNVLQDRRLKRHTINTADQADVLGITTVGATTVIARNALEKEIPIMSTGSQVITDLYAYLYLQMSTHSVLLRFAILISCCLDLISQNKG